MALKSRSRRDPGAPSASLAKVVVELLELGREMLVIPAALFIAIAEYAGGAVLFVWRRALWPLARAVIVAAAAGYRLAARHVTAARAVGVVAIAALVALAASQWLDYRAISIGTDDYAGSVGLIAPPPEVARARAGEAHSWAMLPLAAAGLAILALAVLARRPALARLLVLIGLAATAIAVFVDAPAGLDEGTAAIAYEGAVAHLREGFWAELAAASIVIACGLMLPAYLRPARGPARRSQALAASPVGGAST